MPASSCINLTSDEQTALKDLVREALREAVTHHARLTKEETHSPALLSSQALLSSPALLSSQTLHAPKACFVTLYVRQQLRGCVGTYDAERSLWKNVSEFTYYSATQDRRFIPIVESELANASFDISILSPLQQIANISEQALLHRLKPKVDGLLIKDQSRSAIFLPSVWRSLPTAPEFLDALKLKGGWLRDYWSSDIELFTFTTVMIKGDYENNSREPGFRFSGESPPQ
jgi:AmmeMemoRadiSam system protein A